MRKGAAVASSVVVGWCDAPKRSLQIEMTPQYVMTPLGYDGRPDTELQSGLYELRNMQVPGTARMPGFIGLDVLSQWG